jgi:type II secretory ATPase GspE/PulE/Tfp pilus assembly ATPase PilB-like protein
MNAAPDKKKKPLGQLLLEKGLVTQKHIDYALQAQKTTGEYMGEVFGRLGFITEHDTIQALAEQNRLPYQDVDTALPDKQTLELFNKNFCLKHVFLPIGIHDGKIDIVTNDISDPRIGRTILRQTGLNPRFFVAEKSKIINAVNKFYYFLENPVEQLIQHEVNLLAQDVEMARGMDKLISHFLHQAVKMRATDIHLQPLGRTIDISFRIDGVMMPVCSLPAELKRLITSLKMKADMDIAEQRLPQDGRFTATILNNAYDFRVSTLVSPQGENMVLRVLPMESSIMGMEQLGFFDEHVKLVSHMFKEPFGIILLTGPTGSGKSTTLYAGIRKLNLLEKNVLTVEEPIEYNVPLLRQTQVNERAGYTFSSAIPYFLRHDPDVILVGEIRDEETAATAVTASTTGHLVLSTMHTNSSVGAVPRLRDLGVRPFLIADSLIGVLSQRLVRKVCVACRQPYTPRPWEKHYLGKAAPEHLYRGKGCEICSGSGYFGRTLIYEILTVNRRMANMIEAGAQVADIIAVARKHGFVDMAAVMRRKVAQGITTTEEAVRILGTIRQKAA